jgi:hypothetical protein
MPTRPLRRPAREAAWPLALVAGGLLLAIGLVDPFREMSTQDDSWAYARTLLHWIRSGDYRLDNWSAANMPVQVFMAGSLAKVFGYSHTLLRCTTLALLVTGLTAFYGLLREFGSSRPHAALLTLTLLASPLTLMLSFTFMSDVQFLGWLLLSLWLMVRGLRRERLLHMLLGSTAAACAIGTRQFGLAILGGLLVAAISPCARRRPVALRLLLAAAVLPVLAAVWQWQVGHNTPNFTQAFRLREQALFIARPLDVLLWEGVWRVAMIVMYVGLLMLPAWPLVAGFLQPRIEPRDRSERTLYPFLAPVVLALFMAALLTKAWLAGSGLTERPDPRPGIAAVVLPLHWMLPLAMQETGAPLFKLQIAGLLLAAWVGGLLLARAPAWRPLQTRPHGALVGGTGLSLVGLHLAYVQFNDTYLVSLLPFGLIAVAALIRRARPTPRALFAASTLGAMLLIAATSLWMRGSYNRQQALWDAADALKAHGVASHRIAGSLHWLEYEGAFDDWLAAGAPGLDQARVPVKLVGEDPLHDPFYRWLALRNRHGDFWLEVSEKKAHPPGWRITETKSYRDALFNVQQVWTLSREKPD